MNDIENQERAWAEALNKTKQRAALAQRVPLALRESAVRSELAAMKRAIKTALAEHTDDATTLVKRAIRLRAELAAMAAAKTDPSRHKDIIAAYMHDCEVLLKAVHASRV